MLILFLQTIARWTSHGGNDDLTWQNFGATQVVADCWPHSWTNRQWDQKLLELSSEAQSARHGRKPEAATSSDAAVGVVVRFLNRNQSWRLPLLQPVGHVRSPIANRRKTSHGGVARDPPPLQRSRPLHHHQAPAPKQHRLPCDAARWIHSIRAHKQRRHMFWGIMWPSITRRVQLFVQLGTVWQHPKTSFLHASLLTGKRSTVPAILPFAATGRLPMQRFRLNWLHKHQLHPRVH